MSIVPVTKFDANYFLLDQEQLNTYWAYRDKLHFHCCFSETDANMSGNIIFILDTDAIKGTNLQQFDAINLDIKYSGNATTLCIALRDFDSHFSTATDSDSTKFNVINLRTVDLAEPLRNKPGEFIVANWSIHNLIYRMIRPTLIFVMSLTFLSKLKVTKKIVNTIFN